MRGEQMINAPYEKEFVFHDGRRAKNILELNDVIEQLADYDFSEFVNDQKNDFANWIQEVLQDRRLAEMLRTTISKHYTVDLLRRRIREQNEEEYYLNIAGNAIKGDIMGLHKPKSNISLETYKLESDPLHQKKEIEELEHRKNIVRDYLTKVNSKFRENHHAPSHSESKATGEHQNHEEHHAASQKLKVEEQTKEAEEQKHSKEERQLPNIAVPVDEKRTNIVQANVEPKNKWYEFFAKKKLSKKEIEHNIVAETDKQKPEVQLEQQIAQNSSENILWILLYGLLIGLIIILLIYKFVFQK
jgi:hypothetical protein